MRIGDGYRTLTAITAYGLLCGCSDSGASAGLHDAATRSSAVDAWLGRWNGPEGTFLLLERGDGGYDVTIQNLDGPRVFRGTAVGKRLQFERDGVMESIRATKGTATGMKWLSDKSDCLTIRSGEGYCRD
jgi:hypothetical protein